MTQQKMRKISFSALLNSEEIHFVEKFIDLEMELTRRGFSIASHGRIDWNKIQNKYSYEVQDDQQAAKAVTEIIQAYNLTGSAMLVWTDANLNPLTIEIDDICKYAVEICEEDWDCWIISVSNNWVIEKYHEGEVCYASGGDVL